MCLADAAQVTSSLANVLGYQFTWLLSYASVAAGVVCILSRMTLASAWPLSPKWILGLGCPINIANFRKSMEFAKTQRNSPNSGTATM